MRNVRNHGLKAGIVGRSPEAINVRTKVPGKKHSRSAPTTNAVVLSALCSFANLSNSSCGICSVLIFFWCRNISRYKIKYENTMKRMQEIPINATERSEITFIDSLSIGLDTPEMKETIQTVITATLILRVVTRRG